MMQLTGVKTRIKYLDKQIRFLQKQVDKLPAGKIVCYKNRKAKYSKWYHVINQKMTFIPKKDRYFASKLAYKRYLEARIEDLMIERNITLDELKRKNIPIDGGSRTEAVLSDPYLSELLTGQFMIESEKIKGWEMEKYNQNPFYPENLTHPTIAGFNVRSKSEEAIVMALRTNQIAFRYECELKMDGVTYYPDFMIVHPRTEQIYLWEHFGSMDDNDYAHKVFRKLEHYNANGYRINVNLITTYETKDKPFGYNEAEEMVWKFFLS